MRPILLALCLAIAAAPLHGQAAPDSAARMAAARDLLAASHAKETYDRTMQSMLTSFARSTGTNAPRVATAMRAFLEENMGWSQVESDMLAVYVSVMTADEMREVATVYRTPGGKLLLERLPAVMEKTNALAQQRMVKLMPRLQRVMADAIADELNDAKAKKARPRADTTQGPAALR